MSKRANAILQRLRDAEIFEARTLWASIPAHAHEEPVTPEGFDDDPQEVFDGVRETVSLLKRRGVSLYERETAGSYRVLDALTVLHADHMITDDEFLAGKVYGSLWRQAHDLIRPTGWRFTEVFEARLQKMLDFARLQREALAPSPLMRNILDDVCGQGHRVANWVHLAVLVGGLSRLAAFFEMYGHTEWMTDYA